MDYLYLSTVPIEEPCLQVGKSDYAEMKAEAFEYIKALRLHFNVPSNFGDSIQITLKRENHDYGSYPAVIVQFNDRDPEASELAYKIEAEEPRTWEELGMERPFPHLDYLRG